MKYDGIVCDCVKSGKGVCAGCHVAAGVTDPRRLTLDQWNCIVAAYAASHPNGGEGPMFFRCENSQLSVGWNCGGFTKDGNSYESVSPAYCAGGEWRTAMLAVRSDLIEWAYKEMKKADKDRKAGKVRCPECEQATLF